VARTSSTAAVRLDQIQADAAIDREAAYKTGVLDGRLEGRNQALTNVAIVAGVTAATMLLLFFVVKAGDQAIVRNL